VIKKRQSPPQLVKLEGVTIKYWIRHLPPYQHENYSSFFKKFSILSTKTSMFYHEHKELIEYLAKGTKSQVSCCGAKIINYVQDWQNCQIPSYNKWVCRTYIQIREDLNKEHSLHVIREAIELLIHLGFLERCQNLTAENGRNGQIRTYQYRVYTDRIKAALETMKNSSGL